LKIDPFWTWLLGGPPLTGVAIVSDAVRFVVLHKFGGMYIDADILLLRDLQPFYIHEFAYRWSTRDEFNTAVLRLHPQSMISSKLIDLAQGNRNPRKFFPTSIRSYLHPIILNRLPCVFFDPLWIVADGADQQATRIWKLTDDAKDTFETVFHKESELSRRGRTALNGAFAFHWHALHRAGKFEEGSFLYHWNQFLESQLLEKI
jgi:WD repeat and SOF domain-containing protein 1